MYTFWTFGSEGVLFLEMRSWRFLDADPEKVKKPMEKHIGSCVAVWKNPRWKTLRPRSFYGFVQAFGYYSSCLDCTTSTSEPWRVKRTTADVEDMSSIFKTPKKFTMNWVILYVIHNIYIYIPWATKPEKIYRFWPPKNHVYHKTNSKNVGFGGSWYININIWFWILHVWYMYIALRITMIFPDLFCTQLGKRVVIQQGELQHGSKARV